MANGGQRPDCSANTVLGYLSTLALCMFDPAANQQGGEDVLLIMRFDREKTAKGYTRARMVSGPTILRADEAPEARRN